MLAVTLARKCGHTSIGTSLQRCGDAFSGCTTLLAKRNVSLLSESSESVHRSMIGFSRRHLTLTDKQTHLLERNCLVNLCSSRQFCESKKEEPKSDEEHANNHPGLMEFFDEPENWGETLVRVGRSWKLEELRLKSNNDLHKLWFVLYKEKNMLLTMQENCFAEGYYFPSPERIEKVEESMENLEKVVRERNRAYFQLEVGEKATAERGRVFRPDPFGRWSWQLLNEHLLPYRLSKTWRAVFGPGHGKDVQDFLRRYGERIKNQKFSQLFAKHKQVRQILRRFPDTDLDYLQSIYPQVPVKHYKENLDYYPEYQHHIDQTVLLHRKRFRRART